MDGREELRVARVGEDAIERGNVGKEAKDALIIAARSMIAVQKKVWHQPKACCYRKPVVSKLLWKRRDCEKGEGKIADVNKEKKELKQKVSRLSSELMQRDNSVKEFDLQVQSLNKSSEKLSRENESLQVTKKDH